MAFKVLLPFLFVAAVSARSLDTSQRNYCLSDDDTPYPYFGTKTPYEFLKKDPQPLSTCEPLQMWIFSRHGTRHADEEDLEEMKLSIDVRKDILKNYESTVAGGLCDKDLQGIRNWSWNTTIESEPEFLTEQGWKDLLGLAKRYQNLYPGLLGTYSEKDFYFRHTMTQRTELSCKAFIDGLFGENAHQNVNIETPLEVDMVLRSYEHCQAWKEDVDENDDRKEEKRVFRQSNEYKKLQEDLSKRLGFSKVLKKDPIDSMYDNCRFDKSRQLDKVSPWCSVFSKSELNIMEYYSDLTRFYKSSYGHAHHPKLGCTPLKHLRDTLKKTIAAGGAAEPRVVGLFSHDTMLDMMFTTIGYAKDYKPLKGSDFQDLLVDRKYRTSLNTPFAANLVAVLNRCAGGEFKIQFFLNERPWRLDGCPDGVCDWAFFDNLTASANECDLSFCDRS